MSAIASRFHTSVGVLARANGISNPNFIQAGQSLQIPDGFDPPKAPPAGNTSNGNPGQYTVKSGDTLGGIAERFQTSVGALQSLNQISNPNRIFAGQRLQLPNATPTTPAQPPAASSGVMYTVKSGDTLSGIATRHNTSVNVLQQLNGISNPNFISVGQQIRLPSVAPTQPVQTPPSGPSSGGLSQAQLQNIMPHLSSARAAQMLPHLNRAMAEAEINTPGRKAAFVAQLAVESGELRYMEEIADGSAYEGRRDLGNTQPGDGKRFKGRGPIQLTGRANYEAAGRDLGLDLVGNPAQVAQPDVGFRVAAWFWKTRGLNGLADSGNFDAITRRINGGYNGKAERDRYYGVAKQVLGA